jgi:hypothetical protein
MTFFHVVIAGEWLVLEAAMPAFAMLTPALMKSVGDVEKRRVYFLKLPTGVQLKEG